MECGKKCLFFDFYKLLKLKKYPIFTQNGKNFRANSPPGQR